MWRLLIATLISLPLPAQPHVPTGSMVDVGGRKLHLNCTGNGAIPVIVTGAGYSFDWILVQQGAEEFTRICTYDPAGFAWSDAGPGPECQDRVSDLHRLLEAAGVKGPFVLVGLSYGALVAREYAAEFPNEVAGMVIVDHAFLDPVSNPQPPREQDERNHGPVLISQTPIVLSMEDISNFKNLPQSSRDLHRWADPKNPPMPSVQAARLCEARLTGKQLGDKPLVVVSTENDAPSYAPLQKKLLALSSNSRQLISKLSFHAVQIDDPRIVVRAIKIVLDAL